MCSLVPIILHEAKFTSWCVFPRLSHQYDGSTGYRSFCSRLCILVKRPHALEPIRVYVPSISLNEQLGFNLFGVQQYFNNIRTPCTV